MATLLQWALFQYALYAYSDTWFCDQAIDYIYYKVAIH